MNIANLNTASDSILATPKTLKNYPCRQCHKPTTWQDNPYKPFCSNRCKLIDFGAWANEEYRVPTLDDSFATDLE